MSDRAQRIASLATLAVGLGAGVQPGQVVSVSVEPGHEELWRAIAEAAYARGALFVDVSIFDPHVKRSRLLHAETQALSYVPPWLGARVTALGQARAAAITIRGASAPRLLDDLDPARLGIDMLPRLPESMENINRRLVNWTIVPYPTPGWAGLVHPDLDPAGALERLWEEVAHVCRIDDADPLASWRQRFDRLRAVATRLNELRLDALRFEGPGTNLTVGLLPSSRWVSAEGETADGIRHVANLPTEEVFTAPDPARVHGTVTATKPLFTSGRTIEGLQVRFEDGRAVSIEASSGAELLRTLVARDEGASRLGEVALVDGQSRIGALGTVFRETLLDENAASHLALGRAYSFTAGERDSDRINHSEIHIDFMVGSDSVTVTGLTQEGSELPLLKGGDWQIL
jgi:aminopeptidase